MSTVLEPEVARPWRPEDGPRPKVWTWPRTDRPALWVWSHGAERYALIVAKQEWAHGTVYYQVEIDPHGDRRVGMRLAPTGTAHGSREPLAASEGSQ
ncbi:hypothetical protein [Streptomyces longwoodensis]|uniref:hypothetical protein n=1 Tax=Streptomyces longwoodensis TaxID=68231 RepID=UPI00384A5BB2